jgi:hypothetical protein
MSVFPFASHLPIIAGTVKLKWMKTNNYKKNNKYLRPKNKKNVKIFPCPLISLILNGFFVSEAQYQGLEK